jgi:hypothetical protein
MLDVSLDFPPLSVTVSYSCFFPFQKVEFRGAVLEPPAALKATEKVLD